MTSDPPGRSNDRTKAAPGRAGPPLVVSVLESISDLDALRDEWDRLLERAREASPFLSWDWQQGWWRYYGSDQALRLCVARRGGRLVGLLPLYRQRAGVPGLRHDRLRLVGTGGDTSPD
jgi:CelD/BcsL family acetyltransferase involved in cellulose biosynthesis